MSLLFPWALGAAFAAAIGVTLLHLLARDRPPRWTLPTARFVAPGTARATRRARTPRDLLLLAVRALALLLAGAAFAAPVLHPEGGNVAQVVVLDLGDDRVADAAIDSARARLRAGDRLIIVDTVLRVVPPGGEGAVLDSVGSVDSLESPDLVVGAAARPTLTAALVAAARAAALLPQQADSAALVMIAPAMQRDAALARARSGWPGRMSIVDVPRAVDSASTQSTALRPPLVRGPASDPVVAAARLAGALTLRGDMAPGAAATLLVRDAASAGDSAWAADGGTLLVWPSDSAAAGLQSRAQRDSVAGIVVDGVAALFPAARTHLPPPGVVTARWIDGEPAATERAHGTGCIRTAAIPVPAVGDVTLRPAFQAALRALLRPCLRAQPAPLDESTRALLAGAGPLARASALRATSSRSPATPWLLGAALALLLLAEPVLRRRGGEPMRGERAAGVAA